jgi:hypothetical protein
VTFSSPGEKQGLGSSDHMLEVFEKKMKEGLGNSGSFLAFRNHFNTSLGSQ